MKRFGTICSVLGLVASLCGCMTDYRWTSSVPESRRTVCVPTFRNESDVTELGSIASRQILREIQREGTFKIAHPSDAALEVQGVIRSATSSYSAGDRRSGMRLSESLFQVVAVVSVIDRADGKVLINNRQYTAVATYVINQDTLTGERNASGRAAEDLAMQIVDDLTSMQW